MDFTDELIWSFFSTAVNSHRAEKLIRPFPEFYKNEKSKNFELLRKDGENKNGDLLKWIKNCFPKLEIVKKSKTVKNLLKGKAQLRPDYVIQVR